jgi:inhibitor of cysteine peptidase
MRYVVAASLCCVVLFAACGKDEPARDVGVSTPSPSASSSASPSPSALASASASPSTSHAAAVTKVDKSDNGKTVTLAQGDILELSLDENPSTGYEWQAKKKPDEAVLAKRSDAYKAPKQTNPPMVGAGGVHTWRYEAVGAGKTALSFDYNPPGGGKPAETFSLSVIVR